MLLCKSISRCLFLKQMITLPVRTAATFSVAELRDHLKNLLKAEYFKGADLDLSTFPDYNVKSQSELPARRMKDSFCEAILPLKNNPEEREKYTNLQMRIRFGRILEDLDSFAVAIAYEHAKNEENTGRPPFSFVTAMVDQIDILNEFITIERDIKFQGNVTWAGSSSLEVTMNVFQEEENGEFIHVLKSKFVMVARSPKTGKAAIINPLLIETADEKAVFAEGEKAKIDRHTATQESLLKMMPTQKETELIHNLFLETIDPSAMTFQHRVKPENAQWMENAKLKNMIICHPESRNIYNKIFGGFLMRQGYELAWANACIFAKTPIYKVSTDNIVFQSPVLIGSLLFLSSAVTYTHDSLIQIKVTAQRVNPEKEEHITTNVFHFTFRSANKSPVQRVVPKSYAEAMLYLEGKRHFEQILSHLKR